MLLAVGLLATPAVADAGMILQDQSSTTFQVNFFEPIGQSFTAEDAAVSFGFFLFPINPQSVNEPLEFRLLNGDGLGGSELTRATLAPASGFDGYFDVDVSAVPLAVGQAYTAVLSLPGSSPYWGLGLQRATDPSSGGRAYFSSGANLDNVAGDDVRFRVTPAGVAVAPVPPGLTVFAAGAAALTGFWGRRRA